jgi:hypothetical protein
MPSNVRHPFSWAGDGWYVRSAKVVTRRRRSKVSQPEWTVPMWTIDELDPALAGVYETPMDPDAPEEPEEPEEPAIEGDDG